MKWWMIKEVKERKEKKVDTMVRSQEKKQTYRRYGRGKIVENAKEKKWKIRKLWKGKRRKEKTML